MDLGSIAGAVSTPAYCFDGAAFAERARLVRGAFGPGVGLCFSVKANPFLLSMLPGEFDRIEKYSAMGQLATAKEVIEYQKWKESLLNG